MDIKRRMMLLGGGPRFAYYVDSVNGLDTNPGTLAQPFQTLEKSDTVTLSSGQTIANKSGSAWTLARTAPQCASLASGAAAQKTKQNLSVAAASTLVSGHGWTAFNNAAGNLNYPDSTSINGVQCIKLTTDGGGVNEAKANRQRLTAVNLNANLALFWIKLDPTTAANFEQLLFQVGSGASAFASMSRCQAVVMPDDANYTHLLSGEWTPFTIGPASFSDATGANMAAIQDWQVKVLDNGSGPCTVYFGGLFLVANDATYPHGVISITFDEGYGGTYANGAPIMAAKNFPGSIYVIRDIIGSGSGETRVMQTSEYAALRDAGWEIGGHAYYRANHDHAAGFVGLPSMTLRDDWMKLQAWLTANGHHRWGLAYPHGGFDRSLLNMVNAYWSYGRAALKRTVETLPYADPLRLRVQQMGRTTTISPNSTVGSVQWMIDQVYNGGGWLILLFHNIVTTEVAAEDVSTARFQSIMDYIQTKGVPVATVKTVLGL